MPETKSRLIKFMGSSDVRVIKRGDNAGGQFVKNPLPVDLVWDRSNNWIVDSADYPDVHPVWWEFLAHDAGNFRDVTDADRVPLNIHQKMFLGMASRGEAELKSADTAFVPEAAEVPIDTPSPAHEVVADEPEDDENSEEDDADDDAPASGRGRSRRS